MERNAFPKLAVNGRADPLTSEPPNSMRSPFPGLFHSLWVSCLHITFSGVIAITPWMELMASHGLKEEIMPALIKVGFFFDSKSLGRMTFTFGSYTFLKGINSLRILSPYCPFCLLGLLLDFWIGCSSTRHHMFASAMSRGRNGH